MKCLACESENLKAIDTIVSEFIAERVYSVTDQLIPTRLYHCQDCGFAFYEKRYTDAEAANLYNGYRSDEYQTVRQKYDSWYTPEINALLGTDQLELQDRRNLIKRICEKYLPQNINHSLDYGGGTGSIYPIGLNIAEQYVYDISGVDTIPGTIRVENYPAAEDLGFELIMCNHVMEHISDLDDFLQLVTGLGNSKTIYYFEVPLDSPFYRKFIDNLQFLFNPYFSKKVIWERFLKMRQPGYFAPMVEHINYFTVEALKKILTRNGLTILTSETNLMKSKFSSGTCISAVCKLSE
jgi:hypothetical protein